MKSFFCPLFFFICLSSAYGQSNSLLELPIKGMNVANTFSKKAKNFSIGDYAVSNIDNHYGAQSRFSFGILGYNFSSTQKESYRYSITNNSKEILVQETERIDEKEINTDIYNIILPVESKYKIAGRISVDSIEFNYAIADQVGLSASSELHEIGVLKDLSKTISIYREKRSIIFKINLYEIGRLELPMNLKYKFSINSDIDTKYQEAILAISAGFLSRIKASQSSF